MESSFFSEEMEKALNWRLLNCEKTYNKQHLHGIKQADLTIFAAETKRAELTHWLTIVPAPVFFLWNPVWAGWVIIAYALIANLPFIITQRYNRGRIESILNSAKIRRWGIKKTKNSFRLKVLSFYYGVLQLKHLINKGLFKISPLNPQASFQVLLSFYY